MAIDAQEKIDRQLIKVVAGLGNPGRAYAATYHNAGRLALKALVPEAAWRVRPGFRYAKSGGLIFVAPEVFMNESGAAVRAALKYFKRAPDELLLLHDESDLPLGEVKFQFARGAAGHKGVASVIAALKTNGFFRARIGIRREDGARRRKAEDFVLKKIGQAEREKLSEAFERIKESLNP